jgi:hypothetical protein
VSIQLRTIALPDQPPVPEPPPIPADEYAHNCAALYDAAGADWVVVYGDREHAANLSFLCGFDPRFEEALLLLGPGGRRVLVVGNEGLGYVGVVPIAVEVSLAQSLSLLGQDRGSAPRLGGLLAELGIAEGQQVAVVGWKYLIASETNDPSAPAFVPAFLVDLLRRLVGPGGRLFDATHLLMHSSTGLRAISSVAQIAIAEWAATRAASAVMRIIKGTRPGMSEREAASLMGYEGDPLTCHMMLSADSGPIVGLRSPRARRIAEGDGVTTAIGFRGSLCSRAGLVRATADAAFSEQFVAPYFQMLSSWWQAIRIGVSGGELHATVMAACAGSAIRPALNPGHLTADDEWVHSPVRPGSKEQIASGMLFQCDIIPTPLPAGQALNCEDTLAIADGALRAALQAGHPELWQRVQQRRQFMREALGITLAEEILPLSNTAAYLPPFWLQSELVCTVAG